MDDNHKSNRFFEFLEKIASFIVFALVCLTIVNVVARRVFDSPIFGVTEIVEYGTLAAICLAAGNATLNRVHPAVSLVTNKLNPRTSLAVLLATDIVSIAVLLYVGLGLAPNILVEAEMGRVTDSLGVPYWIVSGLVVLCILVVATSYVLLIGRDVRNLAKPVGEQAAAAEKMRGSITPIAKDSKNVSEPIVQKEPSRINGVERHENKED